MPARNKVLPIAAVSTAAILAGCSIFAPSSEEMEKLGCPTEPIAALVQIDASGSSGSANIFENRMRILEDITYRTGLCGGRLSVSVFSSSSGASATIYDEEIDIEGATEEAKLRRANATVGEVMRDIRANYLAALATLPQGGTDVTAQFRLAHEYAGQLPEYQLDEYLLTDGFSNIGLDLESNLTIQQATDKAAALAVPDLSGAWVTIAGLGRVDGGSASSAQSESLVAFYSALCDRTQAAACTVVTEYTDRW